MTTIPMVANAGLGYVAQLGGGEHPARVEVFSDIGSVFHVAIGAAAAVVPMEWALALAVAFIGYQISQVATGATWERTGGEIIEFALGMAGVLAARGLR